MKLACPPLQLIPYLVCVHFFPRESVIVLDNNNNDGYDQGCSLKHVEPAIDNILVSCLEFDTDRTCLIIDSRGRGIGNGSSAWDVLQ